MYGAFGRDFPTEDGRRVMVVAISLNQWQTLVRATGVEEHLPAMERAFGADFTQGRGPVPRARRASPRCSRRGSKRTRSTRSARRSTSTACVGARTRRSRQLLDDDWRVSEKNPVFADVDQPGIG